VHVRALIHEAIDKPIPVAGRLNCNASNLFAKRFKHHADSFDAIRQSFAKYALVISIANHLIWWTQGARTTFYMLIADGCAFSKKAIFW
jgi:hypothetical protein